MMSNDIHEEAALFTFGQEYERKISCIVADFTL